MKPKALHHHIPRFYLRGFSSEGKIAVWSKQDDSIRPNQSPDKVAAISGFYSFRDDGGNSYTHTESMLAKIEADASSTMFQIRQQTSTLLPPEMKESLAYFAAAMHARSTRVRKMLEIASLMAKKLGAKDEEIPNEQQQKALMVAELAKWILGNSEWLMKRPWSLIKFGTPVLITSDDPVALMPNRVKPEVGPGIATDSKILFPLSPTELIVMDSPNAPDGDKFVQYYAYETNDTQSVEQKVQIHNEVQIRGCYMEAYGDPDLLKKCRIPDLPVHTGFNMRGVTPSEDPFNQAAESPRPNIR